MTVRTFIAAVLSVIVAALNAPQAQAVTISVAGEPSLVVPPIPPVELLLPPPGASISVGAPDLGIQVASPVPEPSNMLLLVAGGVVVWVLRRKR